MYTYSEIETILNNCKDFKDLGECTASFRFLIEEGYVKSVNLYNTMIVLSDKAFRRISQKK